MRKIVLISCCLAVLLGVRLYGEELSYYFGEGVRFNPAIPTPLEFLGCELGTRVTEHHRIAAYYEKLAEVSDRAQLLTIGQTHEGRHLRILVVSSAENLANLSAIKSARAKVRHGEVVSTPLIVFLGYSVHGNETSGAEAAILSAYYLVAAESEAVKGYLASGIYLLDPVRNPDGQERFAAWVNANAGINVPNTYSLDREHTEVWPGGRGNHYWFDLNRDWINLVQPESRARVALYQDWLPHVQADHHEMGTSSTFFFEPTDPTGNESRFVPRSTYTLNNRFAEYYAKALDGIGSLYYTKEGYDNKNPNFGSTYPDYNGGVGILFEQGSSRGIVQRSPEQGLVTLPHTTRNQLVAALATVEAANANRQALFDLQKEFFTVTGKGDKTVYVIGDPYDHGRVSKFIKLLLSHRLDVYEPATDIIVSGRTYKRGTSYLIPVNQPNSALVQIIFDEKCDYPDVDKLGYGAGFSIAYSTGLSYSKLPSTPPSLGTKVERIADTPPSAFTQSPYAYLIDFRDSRTQPLLFRLIEREILVKSAFKPFSIGTVDGVRDLPQGTLLIPVSLQSLPSGELYKLLKKLSSSEGVEVIPVTTGYSVKGIDLGSSFFRTLDKPNVLVLSGQGTSATEVGEIWHLFDIKLRYPLVRVEAANFSRLTLTDFNRIVLSGGNLPLDAQSIEALKAWVRQGNTLITIGAASQWASRLIELASAKGRDSASVSAASTPALISRSSRLPTSIFETRINLDHPLAFGLTRDILPVVRESIPALPVSEGTVSRYTDSPLLNGYADAAILDRFKNTSSIVVNSYGSGVIIQFGEDPLFRGIWDATERTFINAIVFGNKSRIGFGRYY